MTQEALRMALEAMESVTVECNNFHHPKRDQNHHWAKCPPVVRWDKAITAIKEALAQPEQFCDANCVWTDHHPDCKLAQPEQEPVKEDEEEDTEWIFEQMRGTRGAE